MNKNTNMYRMWLRVPDNISFALEIVFSCFVLSLNLYFPSDNIFWIISFLIFTFVLSIISSFYVGASARSWMVRERMWHWGKKRFESWEELWEWFEETPPEDIELCLADWPGMPLNPDNEG